jgi:hypothetical protein
MGEVAGEKRKRENGREADNIWRKREQEIKREIGIEAENKRDRKRE